MNIALGHDQQPVRARSLRVYGWIPVAALVIGAWIGSVELGSLAPARVNMYLVQPLLWLLPATLAILLLGAGLRAARDTRGVAMPALAIGLAQIGLMILAGVVFGFGQSPYGHSPVTLLLNFWYVGVLLAAAEICRWYILRSLLPRGEVLAVGVAWAVLFVVELPFAGLSQLADPDSAFPFLGSVVLPAAATGLLATYLALTGGPLASIIYLGSLQALTWFSPILPDLPWAVAALIGVLVPVFGLSLISDGQAEQDDAGADGEELGLGTMIAGSLLVLIVWLNLGVFGVTPDVVYGKSMEPGMKTGDIVVTRHTPPGELAVGDVIRFRQGSSVVLHRVMEIHELDGETVFITQGDNNPAPDPPVQPENITGEVVLHIPKAGLPAIYVKELIGSVAG